MKWAYWWHRLNNTGYDEWMCIQAKAGRFRVLYQDNKLSQRMSHSTASNYASMFGGKVEFIETHELTKST